MLVEDMVGDSALRLDLRVPGRLDRPIRWVHTIEIPRPGRFLRGGEVVLTAGVWRTAGVSPGAFVADLAAADVAAVGFGLVPPEHEVPQELVDAAEQHGLTCFVVPVDVAFLQVVEAFVSAKREEWERPLRRHLGQHDTIVAALRLRRGVGSVLDVLHRQAGLRAAVRVAGDLVGGSAPRPEHSVPLVAEGLADAELLLPRPFDHLDVEQHAAVVQAMPFIALEIERDRAVRATELRYAWELFEWVYAGTAGAEGLRARLLSLGLPPDGPLAGVVVRGDHPQVTASRLGEALGDDGVAVERAGSVVAFVRVRGEVGACARWIHASLDHGDVRPQVGVGKPGAAGELRLSLLQAAHAAEAVSSHGNTGWMTHDQLSSPTLLLSMQDPDLLSATARTLLGPVLDHDRRRGSDLLPSLEVFLDTGGRWREAADRLHVHINTLRHRMSRVEELTGRSLTRTPDRVDLYLALRAMRMS